MPKYYRLADGAGSHSIPEGGRLNKTIPKGSKEIIESEIDLIEKFPNKFVKVDPEELKDPRREKALRNREAAKKALPPPPVVVEKPKLKEEVVVEEQDEEEIEIPSNKVDVSARFDLAEKYGFQIMKDKGSGEYFILKDEEQQFEPTKDKGEVTAFLKKAIVEIKKAKKVKE
jgi:hypothetical protein